jgi:hypothetical protein
MLDPFRFRRVSSWDAERSAALMYGAQPWRAVCAAVRGARRTLDEFAAAPMLRADLPIAMLSANRADGLVPPGLAAYLAPDRLAAIRAELRTTSEGLAHRSSRGSWRLVESGHLIAGDRPAVVVDAVLEMLNQLRGAATTAPHS